MVISKNELISRIKKAQQADPEIKALTTLATSTKHEFYVVKCEMLFVIRDGHDLLVVPKIMQSELICNAD